MIIILPLSTSTASENVRTISLAMAIPVELSAGLALVKVGLAVSTIMDLLLAKEPASPGEGRVKVASFCAASFIVPPFKSSAEVDL